MEPKYREVGFGSKLFVPHVLAENAISVTPYIIALFIGIPMLKNADELVL